MTVTKKICLLSDHHLCINPRLWKEAFFYEKTGYDVVVLTMWQSADLLQRDLKILNGHRVVYKTYLNLIPGEINVTLRFCYRLRKRLASELQRILKIGTGWSISHAPEKMFRKALKENANLYAAHLECSFFVGRKLCRLGKKVSFDFEDWYSRDYLTADRSIKLLSNLEAFALNSGLFCTAASQTMADALQKTYKSKNEITVIYNSFPDEKIIQTNFSNVVSDTYPFCMLWTSRTVGPLRGLETLMEALQILNDHPVELHIIGKCVDGYMDFLKNYWTAEIKHRIIFYDFISHDELMKTIPQFDLGLAIENNEPESRNTTITNKILQYLQSGIKVFATDTDGQKEVAVHIPEAVLLVSPGNVLEWCETLGKIIEGLRQPMSNVQIDQFDKIFSWTVQEQKLKQLLTLNL